LSETVQPPAGAEMIFSLLPMGNVGNRMLVYMVAQALARKLGRAAVFNVDLPEWGLNFDRELHHRLMANKAQCCVFADADGTTLEEMVARAVAGNANSVVLQGFFQRYWLLREVEFYRELFTRQPLDIEPFADDELVINIRAGELLGGATSWYPLVPPYFYKILVDRTGLRPVLLGQIDDSLYVQEIMRLFPGARVLPSAGPMVDFNRLRHARHLCVAVSTFSWAAAWLSEAAQIHYPVLGFMHPFCMTHGWDGGGGVDLTPAGDARYLYHLFPILNAAPQFEYLRQLMMLNPVSMPVAPDFMAGLSAKAKLQPGDMNNIGGTAIRYLRRYPEAAWSIAWGQYGTARAHYEQLGRQHGYEFEPMEKLAWRHGRPNLALGKPTLQSSVSQWSRQPTPAQDAAGAVSGEVGDVYNFHTAAEDEPWWRVDLGAICNITEVWLFNRLDHPGLEMRAARLALDIAGKDAAYVEVFRYDSPHPFGGADGRPLVVRFDPGREGRFLRVRLLARECLHLNQVEVYGTQL
jgi:hypothetical protein